jgi:hypothetical protein
MRKPWLIYALITTGFWGVWGAFAEFPTRHGFPETLVYVVWTLTMFPPALYAMHRVGWRVQRDAKSKCLAARGVPLMLISQYLPLQYESIREGRLNNRPRELVLDGIEQVLINYERACRPEAAGRTAIDRGSA